MGGRRGRSSIRTKPSARGRASSLMNLRMASLLAEADGSPLHFVLPYASAKPSSDAKKTSHGVTRRLVRRNGFGSSNEAPSDPTRGIISVHEVACPSHVVKT